MTGIRTTIGYQVFWVVLYWMKPGREEKIHSILVIGAIGDLYVRLLGGSIPFWRQARLALLRHGLP